MEENMECNICGGTDFYKESGYFYCNECQTQSQEVREHVFEEEVTQLKGIRKIKKQNTEKLDSKITSWECYNIVLHSLTEQLINLGADKSLKPIVKCLWMKYLQKLEVLDFKRNTRPRLQLVNSRRDSRILYGVAGKKRRRKKSSDESSTSVDTNSTKRERAKRKKALIQAHYEVLSQKSTQDSTSLHNETLTSLKSPSEKSEKGEEPVSFNRYSVKELKRRTSSSHLRKHKLDTGLNLPCHKLNYSKCSKEYKCGVHYLSPMKIYCILYLGLLINRDEIQLGDLFRFIREGHLTFNNYTDVFPEDFTDKFLNITNNGKNYMFSSKTFRITAAKIAVLLNVTPYIKVVDLTELCQRFCRELNLPDEVYVSVRNLISKVPPNLFFTQKTTIVPNYEGRAMSLILFILKLLFGLDGVTEWKMSKYAQLLNKLDIDKPKMFDIVKWMEYIGYRNVLIREHHFPSMYAANSDEIDSDMFLQYYESRGGKVNESMHLTKEMNDYKELLTKIVQCQNNSSAETKFEPSYTPYSDYFQSLDPSKCYSFKDNSVDFLLRPNKYLDLVSDDWQVKHGGANDHWVIEELKTFRTVRSLSHSSLQLIPVEIIPTGAEKDIDKTIRSKTKVKKSLDPQYVQKMYSDSRKHVFRENKKYVKRVSKEVELITKTENVKCGDYNTHYNPYERYWLYLHMGTDIISKKDVDLHFSKYPSTFRLIFNECARIIEQSTQQLFHEFQFSELYLVFSATYSEKSKKNKLSSANLRCYINQSINHW